RWFAGKARRLRDLTVEDHIALPLPSGGEAHLVIVRVDYVEEDAERYLVPLAWRPLDGGEDDLPAPGHLICRLTAGETEGVLVEGVAEPEVARALLRLMADEVKLKGLH